MILSLIVAMDEQGGIGHHGKLPWRLSTDLKRFKTLTMGHHLVMGRKTWETIGRPLEGRTLIVVTRNRGYRAEGISIVHSLEDALALAERSGDDEVFIIGGGELYREALPRVQRMYITSVKAVVPADTYFPEYLAKDWVEKEARDFGVGEKDQFPTRFRVLERRTT